MVGGWSRRGRPAGGIGALLVGVYEPDGRLVYRGRVGSGFTAAALRSMEQRLRPYRCADSSPFVGDAAGRARAGRSPGYGPSWWSRCEFGERTPDGRLRFPRFLGVRADKRPEEVVRER